MRFVDEYRNEADVQQFVRAIHALVTRPWAIMEICGGQTHTIIKSGLDQLLPEMITLIHGPGCPVCVTALELIDRAIAIACRPEVIFTSVGDMLRVPGSTTNLLASKRAGGDVRMVYSPLDAVRLAQKHPDRQIVFFAVGFRDHRASQCHGGLGSTPAQTAQLLNPVLACPGATGDTGAPQ